MKASPAVGTVVCLVAVQLACLGLVAVVWPGRLQSHRARDLAALIQQHGAAAAAAQSGGDAIRLPGQSLPAAAALARTGGGSATAKTLHRIVDQNPITRTSHYTCMEPVTGLSSPVVTVLTAAEFPDKYTTFVHENRLAFALLHGYRYCEIKAKTDPVRVPAWSKLSWVLALLPCSDFIFHVDADAVIVNHELSFKPWMDFMARNGVQLLLSADYIRESPINFGVFAVRPAAWVYDFFRAMYNQCACDWSRSNDWPNEQGIVYDLLQDHPEWLRQTRVAASKGWNEWWMLNGGRQLSTHLIMHYAGYYPDERHVDCFYNSTCRLEAIMRFRKEAIASGEIQDVPVPPESKFHVAQDTCRSISFKRLVSAEQTYANQGAAIFASSFLDWQTAPDGAIGDIVLGEIACLGHRDKRCNLKFYWNQTSGSGPWTPHNSTVLLPGENHLTRQRT